MTVEEIFSKIVAHMLKGFMVHEQFANYYDFLGLDGYRQCHEHHYEEESKSYREIYHYYVTTYNKLLPNLKFENPNVVPSNWLNYTRQDVDTKTKRIAIQDGLNKWVEWEKDTKHLYQTMYQELMNIGEVGAACKIMELICDVSEELKTAEQYQLNKIATNYDIVDIIEEQKILHKKYK